MRVFALSDIHVDYDVNARWVAGVSQSDYRDDVLILAGDVTHKLPALARCVGTFATAFRTVLFVPGNHDLWVLGDDPQKTSLRKFREVGDTIEASGASMQPFTHNGTLIVPLFGWYDYTFGEPSAELRERWMDYHACRWPAGFGPAEIATYFAALNRPLVPADVTNVITFSHFLPRLDVLPAIAARTRRILNPVLGSTLLERQLRVLNPSIHVYGHSHINRSVRIDGVTYINNAFGYPAEEGIASKQLLCIAEI